MELQTELQTCATETIIEIISYLPSIRDRRALLQVSKRFYHITIPQIYSSWSYFGQNHQHSFKSLHCFLRTILQDQSLASQVQTLDIRDWKVDDPWGLPSPPTPRDTVNEIYDQDIELFCGAVRSLGLEHDLQYFKRYLRRRDEDILLAILIAKLPNLKTLYMTMPARALAIQSIVRGLSERSTPGVLENLERMCVCSGPNTGVSIQSDCKLPFGARLIDQRPKLMAISISTSNILPLFSKSKVSAHSILWAPSTTVESGSKLW